MHVPHVRQRRRSHPRAKLRDLLLASFVAALLAAQQVDPTIELSLG
jgi:hypothetical protein